MIGSDRREAPVGHIRGGSVRRYTYVYNEQCVMYRRQGHQPSEQVPSGIVGDGPRRCTTVGAQPLVQGAWQADALLRSFSFVFNARSGTYLKRTG